QAAKICSVELADHSSRMLSLRDYFEAEVMRAIPGVKINGTGPRICNTSNLCFPNCDGELVLMQLDLHGVAASLGSACSSGSLETSRVLLNMGLSQQAAMSSLRFSLSRFTTKEELDETIAILIKHNFNSTRA